MSGATVTERAIFERRFTVECECEGIDRWGAAIRVGGRQANVLARVTAAPSMTTAIERAVMEACRVQDTTDPTPPRSAPAGWTMYGAGLDIEGGLD